jgi:protein-S-isoprenylcysteine O-methyltransferase Ste14
MYLGLLAAQCGTGLVLREGWVVLLVCATYAALHFGVVLREEAYLSAKFGAEYDAYRARTRRWL